MIGLHFALTKKKSCGLISFSNNGLKIAHKVSVQSIGNFQDGDRTFRKGSPVSPSAFPNVNSSPIPSRFVCTSFQASWFWRAHTLIICSGKLPVKDCPAPNRKSEPKFSKMFCESKPKHPPCFYGYGDYSLVSKNVSYIFKSLSQDNLPKNTFFIDSSTDLQVFSSPQFL